MESFLNGVASNVALAGALALVVFSLTRVWRCPQLAHALWLLVLIKLLAPHVFNVPIYDAWSRPRRAVAAGLSDGPDNPRGVDVPGGTHATTSLTPKRHPDGSERVGVSTDLPARPVETTHWSTSGAPSRAIAVSRILQTVEFLADRHLVPVAGTAFGGSHVKRRIEMIVKRQLNRKMSWGALLVVILLAVCVLPVAAQKRPDTDADNRGLADREPAQNTATHTPKVAEIRELDARIGRLERLVQELNRTVKDAAADSNMPRPIHRRSFVFHPSTSHDSENDGEQQLKATLLALEKEYWEAAGKGDWKVAEKLLADDFFGPYLNSPGSGGEGKASVIAAVTRRRYSDGNMRYAHVRRISKDAVIVTYVYDCKVEESGQVWTYRNHQTTRVWTHKDGHWLLSFSQDFILPGGE
jgi:hypothetical protein